MYVKGGATLKIEPGVTIKGDKDTKGTLIITRNGKIDARERLLLPLFSPRPKRAPATGDWGGIILPGNSREQHYMGTTGRK